MTEQTMTRQTDFPRPDRGSAAATVVGHPAWLQAATWVALPAAGAGLGWVVQAIAGWVASLPMAPFQGPFKLVASLPQPYALIGALAVGAVAGLVLALITHAEALTTTVTDERVTLTRDDTTVTFDRDAIGACFLDGKELVVLGLDGGELAREGYDVDAERLAAAFEAHGFPWHAEDPFDADYRRWVDDQPELPASANAVLRARHKALEKGEKDDVRQLREELAKLDVIVRDRDKRQYWRRRTASSWTNREHGGR